MEGRSIAPPSTCTRAPSGTRSRLAGSFGTAQRIGSSGHLWPRSQNPSTDTVCRGAPRHDEHSANSGVRHRAEHSSGSLLPRCAVFHEPCCGNNTVTSRMFLEEHPRHAAVSYRSTRYPFREGASKAPVRRHWRHWRRVAGGTVDVVYPGVWYHGTHGTMVHHPPSPRWQYTTPSYLPFRLPGSFRWAPQECFPPKSTENTSFRGPDQGFTVSVRHLPGIRVPDPGIP